MDLFVLIGQRNEAYDGQYAPEALAVIDEYGNDENPDYISDALEANKSSGDFSACAIVHISVDGAAIKKALYPNSEVIVAKVL